MATRNEIVFQDFSPTVDDFRHEVLKGLFLQKKTIPSKHLYDAIGSLLFERITQLEEYYLTRAERKILLEHRRTLADLIGPCAVILDYGAGNGEKLELVLQVLDQPRAYLPVDISKNQLLETAEIFMRNYPQVAIRPVCLDFSRVIDLSGVTAYRSLRKVAFFLGSTIGSLDRDSAIGFLKNVSSTVGSEGAVIVGVDLIKDIRITENAYHDVLGVNSQFNLNLLNRINRELNADFDVELFQYRAFLDPRLNQVEMFLESKRSQMIHVGGFPVTLDEGECIHTQSAHQYSIEQFQEMAKEAGLIPKAVWTDEFRFSSLHFLSPLPN